MSSTSKASIASVVNSLKSLVAIVAAIGVAESVKTLIQGEPEKPQLGLLNAYFETGTLHWTFLSMFLLHVANTVRFYHGNMRHMDSLVADEPGRAESGYYSHASTRIIGADFTVILVQMILFGFMAMFINRPSVWLILFSSVLLIDVLWILLMHREKYEAMKREIQFRWLFNNVLHLVLAIILVALFASQRSLDSDSSRWIFMGLVLINTIADLIISRNFYFGFEHENEEGWNALSFKRRTKDIFLAATFSSHLNYEIQEDGTKLVTGFNKEAQEEIMYLYTFLIERNHNVFLSQDIEKWGMNLSKPVEAYERDLNKLKKSSLVVAYIDGFRSDGVIQEITAALHLGKPVVLVKKHGATLSLVISGMVTSRSDIFTEVPHPVNDGYISETELNNALVKHKC